MKAEPETGKGDESMNTIQYDGVRGMLRGVATDGSDWAYQCLEFEQQTGVVIDRPLSAVVTRRPDGMKEYFVVLPARRRG